MSHVFRHLKGILPPEEQASMEQLADMMENMDLYRSMFESFSAPHLRIRNEVTMNEYSELVL